MMADLVSLGAIVRGRVQGVFFRAFVKRTADELGLTGYARNCADGSVEVFAEGERDRLEKFVGYLHSGPPAARVDDVTLDWKEYSGKYANFEVDY